MWQVSINLITFWTENVIKTQSTTIYAVIYNTIIYKYVLKQHLLKGA